MFHCTIHLMSLMAHTFKIAVDRAICAHGHESLKWIPLMGFTRVPSRSSVSGESSSLKVHTFTNISGQKDFLLLKTANKFWRWMVQKESNQRSKERRGKGKEGTMEDFGMSGAWKTKCSRSSVGKSIIQSLKKSFALSLTTTITTPVLSWALGKLL